MTAPFPNEYNLRTVAEASSKPCIICNRSSTKVLITTDNKDFLYTCASHLTDRGFASPIIDEKAAAEKVKAEQLAKEKEAIVKEYEEKMKKKGKEVKKKEEKVDEAKAALDEKDAKLKALDAKSQGSAGVTDEGPRQFTLHRNFYQMRLERKTSIEQAKKQQGRMKDPMFFPSTPKGDIA